MSTVLIANPKAGAGRVGRVLQKLKREIAGALGPLEVQLTGRPGDGTTLARRALERGAERLVVVGGDGSVNEVVNGLFDAHGKPLGSPTLVVVPVGTGGDFARSIGMAGKDVGEALAAASPRRIDLGRAELTAHDGGTVVRHFANISSFGSSGRIVHTVNQTTKRFGAKASFLWGTLKGLATYENQRVRLRVDDHYDEELRRVVVAVANGRYFGGGMKIAPEAVLDDGLLDVTIGGDISLAGFVKLSPRIYAGTHLGQPKVRREVGRTVVAEPLDDEPVLIDLDGEQPGKLPVRYSIVPSAVALLAPWGAAEATGKAA